MHRSVQILIVDDSLPAAEAIASETHEIVKSETVVCTSSRQALDLVKKRKFNLALIDVVLENDRYDGYELAQIVRQKQPSCEVVMISQFYTLDNFRKAIKQGVFDFLGKPLHKREFKETLLRAMSIERPLFRLELNKLTDVLLKMDERTYTSRVLVSLFERMGFNDIYVNHGPQEFGKDIVFHEIDKFGDKEYYGVAVKTGDISKISGKSENIISLIHQAEEAFLVPITLPNDGAVFISRLIIAISGKYTTTALNYMKAKLEHSWTRSTLKFIDGAKVATLIKKHKIP
jgi:CheY-like chemotaxis protein